MVGNGTARRERETKECQEREKGGKRRTNKYQEGKAETNNQKMHKN